jgi:23S rRNA (guanosine2251-2'-O)-methyltransferase
LRSARSEQPGREILYGLHPVTEALRAHRRALHRLRVRKGRGGPELARILALAQALGIPVEEELDASFRRAVAADANTQGVLLEAGPLPILSLPQLMTAGGSPRMLVALDGVEDPQNVGAIARVAEAAGAIGLVLTERRAPPVGPAVARASAGAIERLPVARVPNLVRALEALRAGGYWIFGADAEAPASLFSLADRVFEGDACVVLGAEGRGIRPGVRDQVDHLVRVPMAGALASLNVATAAAVVLFEWVRRRGEAPAPPSPRVPG